MTIASTADRLARPLDADAGIVWVDGRAERYRPGTILRLTEREAIDATGDLRPAAPFELVVVQEIRSPFSVRVDRGRFGTTARAYPPGAFVDAVANVARNSERS